MQPPCESNLCDVLVIGAGPAGLMAGLAAADQGVATVVLDRLADPGLKLLACGGGRCNLTNTLSTAEFYERFGRDGRFIAPAMEALPPRALLDAFERLGITGRVEPNGQVFVVGGGRRALSALMSACRNSGASIRTDSEVEQLSQDSDGWRAKGSFGSIRARAVVLACGGCSWPDLGGTSAGYQLAASIGHSIAPIAPALVGLVLADPWLADCAGVSVQDCQVRVAKKPGLQGRSRGDVLITHRGLSGPAILDISGDVAQRLASTPTVDIVWEPLPDASPGHWQTALERSRRMEGSRMLRTVLDPRIPRSLAQALVVQAGLPADVRCSQASRDGIRALIHLLQGIPLRVKATEGLGKAMVARGGVSLRDVDPSNLASRKAAGVFLAGELLDLDGPCGGFNLQWAFASGHLAGRSAATWAAGG